MRELEAERFARLNLPRHEIQPVLRHAVQLLGMRIGDVVRAPVAIRAVVLGEAVLARVGAAHVPFPEVRGRVAGALEHFGEGRLARRQFQRSRRREDASVRIAAAVVPALVDEGHAQLGRAFAGKEGDPRRRAARRWSVEVRESHAALREFLQIGRADKGAPGLWHRIIHLH